MFHLTLFGDVLIFVAGLLAGWSLPKVGAQVMAWIKKEKKKIKKKK